MRTRTLQIGASTYQIIRKPLKGIYGEIDRSGKKIYLDNSSRRTTNKVILSTLLHEALHGIAGEYGVEEILQAHGAELIVKSLETAICNLFIMNPTFAKELLRALSK